MKLNERQEACIPIANITATEVKINKNEITKATLCYEVPTELNVNVNYLDERSDRESKLNEEDVHINTAIGVAEKNNLMKILNEYEDCFATTIYELGTSKEITCKIETITEEPVTYRPYRLSYSERKKVSEMVNELKSAGIIIDSN